MNTKISFALLMIVIAIIATACGPAIIDNSAPIVPAVPPANNENPELISVTDGSASTTAREAQAPRLWSGEIFLSDNDNPDLVQNAQPTAGECMSDDGLPRRYGGCVE